MENRENKELGRGWDQERDPLGRELDAALAKYAAVEPRAGLEERVLANLRAGKASVADRVWWRWTVAATMAALIIVAVTMAWRSGKSSHPVVIVHPPTTMQTPNEPARQLASNSEGNRVRPSQPIPAPRIVAHRPLPSVTEYQPKLEQFPSPQPLSVQEKIMASYIEQYPEHAALIAQARMETLRRDRAEEMRDAADNDHDIQRSNQ